MRKTRLQIIVEELNQLSFDRKIIVFIETFVWPFYRQSFIKTARGPLTASIALVFQN